MSIPDLCTLTYFAQEYNIMLMPRLKPAIQSLYLESGTLPLRYCAHHCSGFDIQGILKYCTRYRFLKKIAFWCDFVPNKHSLILNASKCMGCFDIHFICPMLARYCVLAECI